MIDQIRSHLTSQILDNSLELSVKLEETALNEAGLKCLEEFRRASNDMAVGVAMMPLWEALLSGKNTIYDLRIPY